MIIRKINKLKREIAAKLPEKVRLSIRKIRRFIKPCVNAVIPEEETKTFSLLKDGFSTVFDVGTREDLSYYKIKKDCSYHLFEPNKKAVDSLERQISSLANHNIILNKFGLSDKNEDNCIYYEDSQSFIINPFNKGTDRGQRYSLRTLGWYVSQNKITKIDFLKIDTEGLDYKIMLGGLDIIKTKVSYIQFEYWDGVKKFIDLIGDKFEMYLMMEPQLLKTIQEETKNMTENQKQIDYTKSLIHLDKNVVDLIDRILAPIGCGGNILGIKKDIKLDIKKITFKLKG